MAVSSLRARSRAALLLDVQAAKDQHDGFHAALRRGAERVSDAT
jgi:hypothetical protein